MNQRLIGQLIGNRYRLTQHISEGGYGNVFMAVDSQLNEQVVAVKLLRSPPPDMTPEYYHQLQERFMDEARVSALLGEHPGIVQVKSYGMYQNRPYLVMEFLKTGPDTGRGLDSIMAREKILFPGRVLRLGIQICDGLNHAHNFHVDLGRYSIRGVVHRDIKPSNIFVMRTPDKREVVKLLDFGISKVMGESNRHLTQSGYFLGTMCYASPEQMRGEQLDARSDIYSLGVLLYEMLTGSLPFNPDTDSLPGWYHVHNYEKPIPFRSRPLPHSIPATLQKVVMACLQKEPQRRPQTMMGLKQLLEAILSQTYPSGSQPIPAKQASPAAPNPLPGLGSNNGSSATPDFQRAMQFVQQKSYKEAIQLFNQMIRREPNESRYYLQRALIHLHQGNWGLAQMDFQGVLRLDPDNQEAQQGLQQAVRQTSAPAPVNIPAPDLHVEHSADESRIASEPLSDSGTLAHQISRLLPVVKWLVGSTLGGSLGLVAGLMVTGSPLTGSGILPQIPGIPMSWVAAGILGLLLGLGWGVGEVVALGHLVQGKLGWIALTTLATLIATLTPALLLEQGSDWGVLLGSSLNQPFLYSLVWAGGTGLLLGLGQWACLWPWGSRSLLWIPLTMMDLMVGVMGSLWLGSVYLVPLALARIPSGLGVLLLGSLDPDLLAVKKSNKKPSEEGLKKPKEKRSLRF